MKSIRIQNLKSIKDSGDVEIKPLTILIGRNSCGKSTFLRAFPLLKQSFEQAVSSPVLWYGDDVDFGSFKNAISSDCNHVDTICFSLKLENVRSFRIGKSITNIYISAKISEKVVNEYIYRFDDNNEIRFVYVKNKKEYDIYINNKPILNHKMKSKGLFDLSLNTSETNNFEFKYIISRFMIENSSDLSYKIIFSDEDDGKLMKYITTLQSNSKFIDSSSKHEIYENVKFNMLDEIVHSILVKIRDLFDNVNYFQPIRARADRFYRVQGLNVRKVDSDGINAPMILYMMDDTRRSKFEKWCEDNFGFSYGIQKVGDYEESTSITVKSNSKNGTINEHNLADTGFGYCQIFPIILSLWLNIDGKASRLYNNDHFIIVEQPELHLHPAMQKKVINIFLNILNKLSFNYRVKFIIETHSETIINYIGKKIIKKELDRNLVNLICCNKIDGYTQFDTMKFNDEGIIENWPIGFFSDED